MNHDLFWTLAQCWVPVWRQKSLNTFIMVSHFSGAKPGSEADSEDSKLYKLFAYVPNLGISQADKTDSLGKLITHSCNSERRWALQTQSWSSGYV